MNLSDDLNLLFTARIAVVNLVTYEETRVLRELTAWARTGAWPAERGLYTWDIGDQFRCLKPARSQFDEKQQATPDNILKKLDDFTGSAVFVLKDFHHIWEARKANVRMLRNLASRWPDTEPAKRLIILTPEHCLPAELKHDVEVVEMTKPSAEEMDALLDRTLGATRALQGMAAGLRQKIVEAALGLSSLQAERTFRLALLESRSGKLDEGCIDRIVETKKAIIRESGALEYYPVSETESQVGGLEALKQWLAQRREAFSDAARAYGIEQPKGVALIGIPGTGKSLCARVTAGMWKLPLLRLDMGAVFAGLLGSSEKNIREAMQIAELIAPCVLWVDEIEKAFAGSGGDSGTASRVLATFLTWMQEKRSPVFVFATANNTKHLPPEFLRKGRFDEVFFLDLPTAEERQAILEVHLRHKNFSMVRQKFDLARLAEETLGFVGAELEAVVKAAMFPAFRDGQRDLDDGDLLQAARDMVPLAKSHATLIEELRALIKNGQARNASRAATDQEVELGRIRGERLLDI
jgi:MoxR-like ATPase